MSTGGIITLAIIAVVLAVIVFALLPRMRRAKEERKLQARRQEVAERHRAEAEAREQKAELAEREARHARAEAELHQHEAQLHERGLADDRLHHDDEHDVVQEGRAGRFERETEVREDTVEHERGTLR